MDNTLEILGMNEFFYVSESVTGHNCDFEWHPVVTTMHEIYGVSKQKHYYSIRLSAEEGICSSGWTTDTVSSMEVSQILRLPSIGYTARQRGVSIEAPVNGDTEVHNDVFHYSAFGGDDYYPCGGYSIEMGIFAPTARKLSARPVWLLSGGSGLGKTFLASKLEGLMVYETDLCETLPEVITEDIIVVGNKYCHSVADIVSRIFGEHKLIAVDFVDFSEKT